MKYEGEILYTSRYLKDLIGLPEEVCKSKCQEIHGRFRFADAKQALKEYQAEKSHRITMWRKLQAEHRCVHRVGFDYCGEPTHVPGWPYCDKHLPACVFSRRHIKELRAGYRKSGKCIAIVDGQLCGKPVKEGRQRCAECIARSRSK